MNTSITQHDTAIHHQLYHSKFISLQNFFHRPLY